MARYILRTSFNIYYIQLIRRCNVNNKVIKKECEEIWAKNKYYVLSKSHKIYLEIREYSTTLY